MPPLTLQISSILQSLETLNVSEEISPLDTMCRSKSHYFAVGRSALIAVSAALAARLSFHGGNEGIERILDFGCGFGRVARWLRVAFPDSSLSVTEIDRAGADWCISKFKCDDVTDDIPKARFDLIWAGSVLTHLNECIGGQVIDAMTEALAPNGVLVFTSQGRFAANGCLNYLLSQRTDETYHIYNLPRPDIQSVLKNYWGRGYGYVDYPGQKDYGVAIIDPDWFLRHITKSPRYIRLLTNEKGWDTHQDVNAFMQNHLQDDRKGWYHLDYPKAAAKLASE